MRCHSWEWPGRGHCPQKRFDDYSSRDIGNDRQDPFRLAIEPRVRSAWSCKFWSSRSRSQIHWLWTYHFNAQSRLVEQRCSWGASQSRWSSGSVRHRCQRRGSCRNAMGIGPKLCGLCLCDGRNGCRGRLDCERSSDARFCTLRTWTHSGCAPQR